MTAEATEQWSKRGLVKTVDNWRATRGFQVKSAPTQDDALTAPILDGGGALVPVINEAHPDNSRLKCDSIDPKSPGQSYWETLYTYSIPQDGDQHVGTGASEEENNDPLLQPVLISWGDVNATEEIESDRDGNAITMSSRRPPAQRATKRVTWKELTITRPEPYFDIVTSNTYTDTVNSKAFTIKGGGEVAAGEMYCVSILPSSEYQPDALFMNIRYRFWLRAGGFQFRMVDQDIYKFLTGQNASQKILDADGSEATAPKLLNGLGAPLGSGDTGIGLPTGATTFTSDFAVFLDYNIYPAKNFSNLRLF